jgi:hypothetical protein
MLTSCTTSKGADTSTTSALQEITGYGDFSGVSFLEVDWEAVNLAQVACMNDQGWAVVLDGPTAMEMPDVPSAQQSQMAHDFDACTAGLKIPDFEPPTEQAVAEFYEALLETKRCLEGLGYDIEEPPALDTFIDSYATGPWHPYLSLPNLTKAQLDDIDAQCPQPR